jgi:hypothetical protein
VSTFGTDQRSVRDAAVELIDFGREGSIPALPCPARLDASICSRPPPSQLDFLSVATKGAHALVRLVCLFIWPYSIDILRAASFFTALFSERP